MRLWDDGKCAEVPLSERCTVFSTRRIKLRKVHVQVMLVDDSRACKLCRHIYVVSAAIHVHSSTCGDLHPVIC